MASAQNWTMEKSKSTLSVEAVQTEKPFEGHFNDFQANITLDPQDLTKAALSVNVRTESFTSSASDRDETAKQPEWFDVSKFPEAVFESSEISHVSGDDYFAKGKLRIKDVERPLELPFKLKVTGDRAVADGSLKLNRTDYKVGVGDWADGVFVGLDVVLNFHIEATRS